MSLAVRFTRNSQTQRITAQICAPASSAPWGSCSPQLPFDRLLPVGFQSGWKTYITSTIAEIDALIAQHQIAGKPEAPFELPLADAITILGKVYSMLEFEESGYPQNHDELLGALTHLSMNTSEESERGLVWALWRGDRDLKRIRDSGRFNNAPDSPHREGKIAREIGTHVPVLMLLRQNGREEDGWRGTPFYWSVVLAPSDTRTAIFANQVRPEALEPDDDADSEN